MSEEGSQLISQVGASTGESADSTKYTIRPQGLTQAQRHAQSKPRFAEFMCSHVEVNFALRNLVIQLFITTLGFPICATRLEGRHSEQLLGERTQLQDYTKSYV
jgi:hypothetical protein